MTYTEAVDWLYAAVPNFQRDGGSKNYKIGLEGPTQLWKELGHPASGIPTIHVAGTNGKGSTVHLLASGMRAMGLRVGVFSSPHLFSFRERAKIGTEEVPEDFVANWVSDNRVRFEKGGYSFFELTLMLALQWFEHENVDWIVLETGMGGRLDATNICSPELCVITNIGLDHVQWLGTTRPEIAGEKAGIIKPGVPVVVVERDQATEPVFVAKAAQEGAPLFWAQPANYTTDLRGSYQKENVAGAATALRLLFPESEAVWATGFERVVKNTGLRGRWEVFGERPLRVCDTGHNESAFTYLVPQALAATQGTIHWVLGTSGDKDLKGILEKLPRERSLYYWTGTRSPRTLRGEELARRAVEWTLQGNAYEEVAAALKAAEAAASAHDLIYVGGSTFVVADLAL